MLGFDKIIMIKNSLAMKLFERHKHAYSLSGYFPRVWFFSKNSSTEAWAASNSGASMLPALTFVVGMLHSSSAMAGLMVWAPLNTTSTTSNANKICTNAGYRVSGGEAVNNATGNSTATLTFQCLRADNKWIGGFSTTGTCPGNEKVTSWSGAAHNFVCTLIIPPKGLGASNSCSGPNPTPTTPNPITIGTGNKYLIENGYVGPGIFPLVFSQTYNSAKIGASAWDSNLLNRFVYKKSDGTDTTVFRGTGKGFKFVKSGAAWVAESDITDTLVELVSGGVTIGWTYTTANGEVESYDAQGKLLSVTDRNGLTHNYFYSNGTVQGGGYILDANGNPTATVLPAGRVIQISDAFGRTIKFGYDVNNRLVKMIDPSEQEYLYQYNSSNDITLIKYPDNTTKQYLYNEQAYTANTNLPHALTGIIDENGTRFATYRYDVKGLAIAEEHAPGSGLGINRYQLNFAKDAAGNILSNTVTDPLGTSRTFQYQLILDVAKTTGQSQPGGSGCGPASSALTYDANGNVSSRTDFNGSKTCYGYDMSRNLEIARIEGLPSAASCSTALAATSLAAPARKFTTQWHATYRLPMLIAEPLRRTQWQHDAKGNVLSKTVQATNDATGAAGAAAVTVGAPRVWSYTYNQFGQVLTATGPRTDVVDTTTYVYDDATGNLATVTNAAGHVTTFSNYDPHGRAGTITDANGLVTELQYSPRGWLTSRSVTGNGTSELTGYEYDGVGQLKKVNLPDGSWVGYDYDDAHRMTAIYDSLDNRITYTLDNIGNRIKEEVKDPSGVLARQTTRIYDALNRLKEITGGAQ